MTNPILDRNISLICFTQFSSKSCVMRRKIAELETSTNLEELMSATHFLLPFNSQKSYPMTVL